MPFLRVVTHAFFIFLPLRAPLSRAQSTGGTPVPKAGLRGNAANPGKLNNGDFALWRDNGNHSPSQRALPAGSRAAAGDK
jgi:hypothetical protein